MSSTATLHMAQQEIMKDDEDIDLIQKSNEEHRVNFLLAIPEELCDYIMQFLEPDDLICCEEVSSDMYKFSHQQYLWKRFCEIDWKGKVINKFTSQLFKDGERDWKNLYYDAMCDGEREQMTPEDLRNTKWTYQSKMRGYFTGEMVFSRDHYKSVQNFGGGEYSVDLGVWRISEDGRTIYRRGTLSFPSLKVTRTEDWGWIAEHQFTDFVCVQDKIL
ncbi:hypothetical protein AKO1_012677 [Acrasis kona]|uniref:F-box domain-containing protein n=1 Tax=Acrasis kona TaxID=1008807 RepID=A0AAW2YVC1_9EUKA